MARKPAEVKSRKDFINNSNMPSLESDQEVLDLYNSWLMSVKFFIQQTCDDYGIQDLTSASQNQFNGVLTAVGNNLFKGSKILQKVYTRDDIKQGYEYLDKTTGYDDIKLNILVDLYLFICDIYDKAVTIRGFRALSGIGYTTFDKWVQGDRLNSNHEILINKLYRSREESLSDILTTAKRNPVGLLGVLNHEFGWNMPGVTRENKTKIAVETSDLPSLSDMVNVAPGIPIDDTKV